MPQRSQSRRELRDLVPRQAEGPEGFELAHCRGKLLNLVPIQTQGLQFLQLADVTG